MKFLKAGFLDKMWFKNNYLLFIALWIAAIAIFAYAWMPGGMDVDSCHYGVVAKEILRTNKWLGIYDPIDGADFYYHFPLAIWVTTVLFKFFGVSVFTARLFSMLCAVMLVGVLFYFGRLLKNQWVGFFAGVSFIFTNHIVRIARKFRMDIPLSLFITLAMLCFVLAQKRSRRYYLLFGLFTSLAIFTKDISGFFPLAIAFIYFAIRLKWKEFFHPLFIIGLLVAIGPVFIWILADKKVLFNPWFNCNFRHLLSSSGFSVTWYYYIWVLLTKYFYFLPFAAYGGYLAIKEARRSKSYEFYLLIIWALIFPIAFSFGRQKLHYFILPIYPAASLLVGLCWDKIFKENLKTNIAKWAKYVLIISSIVMLCFPLNIRSKRFSETIKIAPFVDEVLKQFPEYEFIVYKEDRASFLFYSQELTELTYISDKDSLEKELNSYSTKPRLFYMSVENFEEVNSAIRQMYRVILRHRNKIIIESRRDPEAVIILP